MPFYRKKPVVIEAIRLPSLDEDSSQELLDWLADHENEWESERDGCLSIFTGEGTMTANPGDWIIKGIKGELYPCKPDIFELTYDRA